MTETKKVFHITTPEQWVKSLEIGQYVSETFDQEGFIHFSLENQVLATANRHYHGVTGLILLRIETTRLSAKLKYEMAPSGEEFPHLYGPLNLDAVEKVFDFPPSSNGDFVEMPEKTL
jgi:uncharacterized protein (DUF952 family)